MRLVCIRLSAGMKTLWCGVGWSQLLLLPRCPTEIKGCCSNPQFTLILLHGYFRAFTYNCNVRFYLMPATCIILLLWASPVKTTSWTITYTKPEQAVALLPLCLGKPKAAHRQECHPPSASSLLFLVMLLIMGLHSNNENLRKRRF